MKRIFKAITLTLALALTVCLGIFAVACAPEEEGDDPNAYVVTIVDADGNAIDGTAAEFADAYIQVCLPGEGGMCSQYEGAVDENGKCSFKKDELGADFQNSDSFVIHFYKLQGVELVELADEITVTDSNKKVTMTLKNA